MEKSQGIFTFGAVRLMWLAGAAVATVAAMAPAKAESPAEWVGHEINSLSQLYTELHQAPELSFQERNTAARMAKLLRELEFDVTTDVGGHGVVGLLRNGAGPTLLLRADMDALPVAEETNLPYASTVRTEDSRGAAVGVMHACGHDMHMTNLIGALRYLATHRDQWRGTLMPIFQPAEERGGGAEAMLNDGLFTRFPKPKFGVALHVAADRATGRVGCRPGYALANVDSVDITIRGRGGHGAHPHTTIDPIVVAARLILDLQTIVSREVNPVEPAVVTVGAVHGGSKHNVIGDDCTLQLTVRSFSPTVRQQLLDAIRRKANAAAASAGAADPEIQVSDGTPSLYNDPKLVARVMPAVGRALGEKNVEESDPSMGGEDFSRYGLAGVPVMMIFVGSVSPERLAAYKEADGAPPSLHSPRFYPDVEPTIRAGVTAFCAAALELLPPEAKLTPGEAAGE